MPDASSFVWGAAGALPGSSSPVTNDHVYPDQQDLSVITVLAPKRVPVPPHVNINCIGTDKSNDDRKYEAGKDNLAEFITQLQTAGSASPVGTIETTGNTFSGPACDAVAAQLEQQGELSVALMNNMFTQRKIPEIHPALSRFTDVFVKSSRLTVLDLSDNALNLDGAKAISPFLKECLSLRELYLHNTGLGPYGGVFIADALLEACMKGRRTGRPYNLQRFVLGRSRLETSGIKYANVFAAIGTLVEVQMSQNGMDDEAIVALYKSMCLNPNLEVLNLSDNHGGHYDGAKAAARALLACQKLRVVKCNDHTFGERGGLELAKGLQDGCPALEILDGMNNDFTPAVANAMAIALAGKTHLRWACLHFNNFGEAALQALMEALGDRTPALGTVPPGSDPDAEYEDYYDSEDDEEPNDGDTIPFTDTPEREYFADFVQEGGAPAAAAAAAAAPANPGGGGGQLFNQLGVATPAELARLNRALVHLRLLVSEDGCWSSTPERDIVEAWAQLGKGGLSAPVTKVVRGFASDAAMQQRGMFNQPPYTAGSLADNSRLEALAAL